MLGKKISVSAIIALLSLNAFSQQTSTGIVSKYNPQEVFAPLSYQGYSTPFRSANGAPGAKYWQNRVDYVINANLDTATKQLSAKETIHYTNNSPDSLYSLWLQLDQNTYTATARSKYYTGFASSEFTQGYQIT